MQLPFAVGHPNHASSVKCSVLGLATRKIFIAVNLVRRAPEPRSLDGVDIAVVRAGPGWLPDLHPSR